MKPRSAPPPETTPSSPAEVPTTYDVVISDDAVRELSRHATRLHVSRECLAELLLQLLAGSAYHDKIGVGRKPKALAGLNDDVIGTVVLKLRRDVVDGLEELASRTGVSPAKMLAAVLATYASKLSSLPVIAAKRMSIFN